VSLKVLTEGSQARSAVLKCAAIPSGVCSRHAARCSLYVLQASSYPTIVARRPAVLKCAAIPSENKSSICKQLMLVICGVVDFGLFSMGFVATNEIPNNYSQIINVVGVMCILEARTCSKYPCYIHSRQQ
jgi:hypothetical protein